MNTFVIKDSVIIEPQYLDHNLHIYLEKKVKDSFIGKCFKEYGYIVDVIKILKSKSRITSSDSTIVWDLEFEISSLFPEVGKKYKTFSFINTFVFEKFKSSLFNLYEINNNNTLTSIQIFVMNGNKDKDKLSFPGCDCVVDCSNVNSPSEIDVVVECVAYKNGQFYITGKHVH